jgi:hypothetical protein
MIGAWRLVVLGAFNPQPLRSTPPRGSSSSVRRAWAGNIRSDRGCGSGSRWDPGADRAAIYEGFEQVSWAPFVMDGFDEAKKALSGADPTCDTELGAVVMALAEILRRTKT